MTAQQVVEGYACICGFTTQNKTEFTSHVMHSAKREGKGTHKSRGRINIETGEVILPPWEERSPEDRERTKCDGLTGAGDNGDNKGDEGEEKGDKDGDKGDKGEKGDQTGKAGKDTKSVKKEPSVSATTVVQDAQEIRVIPRIFTMDYTPIMRSAQDAASRVWGWRDNMPFANFIDTCLFLFFEEKGITLCGYIVEPVSEKEAEHAG